MPETVIKKKDEKPVVLPSSKVEAELSNAFGSRVVRHTCGTDPRPDNNYILRYGVKPNKGDSSNTHAEIIRKEFIPDLIHAAAKDVGIDAILKQVAMGVKSFDSIIDNGSGSVDDTLIPDGSAPVDYLLEKEKEKSDKIIEDLGLDASKVTPDNIESLVNDLVKAALDKAKAAKPSEGE